MEEHPHVTEQAVQQSLNPETQSFESLDRSSMTSAQRHLLPLRVVTRRNVPDWIFEMCYVCCASMAEAQYIARHLWHDDYYIVARAEYEEVVRRWRAEHLSGLIRLRQVEYIKQGNRFVHYAEVI